MKAVDVCIEAAQYGVVVEEGKGSARFSVAGDPITWCRYARAGEWRCYSTYGLKHTANTKAKAFNWCLDLAVNGP